MATVGIRGLTVYAQNFQMFEVSNLEEAQPLHTT